MAGPRVDAHPHLVAPRLISLARDDGERHRVVLRRDAEGRWTAEIGGVAVRAPIFPEVTDLGGRWERMAGQGVDVHVVSGWNEFYGYQLDADDGVWWCRLQNDTLAETVAEHPDRLVGLATVPLQAPGAAAIELRRAVVELGMRGAMICTNVRGENLDAPELDPFWAAAAELGVPIMLHPGGAASAGAERMRRYFLTNLVGNPTDTTLAAASLLFGGVLERFGDLRFLLVHGGGFFPYQLGRLQKGFDVRPDIVGSPDRRPLDVAARFYYDTLLHFGPALDHLVRVAGPTRLLFGTDYPFEMAERRPVDDVLKSDALAAADVDAVAGANALALFEIQSGRSTDLRDAERGSDSG